MRFFLIICFLMISFYSIAEETDMDVEFQAQINDILSQLIQKDNHLVDAINRAGNTALNILVRSDNVEAIEELVLSAGADVNKANDAGDTPLISVACYNTTPQNVEIAKILLANGADINAQEDVGLTALHCAIMTGKFPLVLVLLDQEGVNVSLPDDDGDTVLHLLAHMGIRIDFNIEGMEQEESIEQLKSILESEMNSSDGVFRTR